MKEVNLIISVVIVLAIAGGVTAYTMINPGNDGGFSNLTSFTPSDDSASDAGGSGVGSNDSNGGGSGKSGSGSIGSTSNNGGSGSGISADKAKSIASKFIEEPGCYAGNPEKLDDGNWYVPIIDESGARVSGIEIDKDTGANIGRV